MYRSFTSLVRFIPRYFILFEALVNRIVFLIFVSVSSLLDVKCNCFLNIDFVSCYCAEFIYKSSFLVESLGFSLYTIMSSENKERFTFSFTIWMPFVSSSCLISVARTSSTVLNKRGEGGHPCLVPKLKGNTCSFCPLSMMLAVGLSYMAFIMFRSVPSIKPR